MLQQIVGASAAMAVVRDELARLVARPAAASKRLPPVLIQGETGTGKGLIARVIHATGPRAQAAFVDVNCAAIPDTLLESELFGFERGAFTDARQAKPGLLHVAHRGTIFLDEIGLIPDALQAKLLKALEDRAVRRLGGTHAEPADAWVLAATSEDLAAAIRSRHFREDLYHRLAVVTLRLPPLRERDSDVLLLARHYLVQACSEYGLPLKRLTADAEAALLAYTWPGNVRELANVMERVALMVDAEEVGADTLRLPRAPRLPSTPAGVRESVDEQMASVEHARIEEALRAESWNISRAAARLGLPRNTLRYRMVRHGLTASAEPSARRFEPPLPVADMDGGLDSPGRPSPVRWQRTRITLFHAVVAADAAPEHEQGRVLEEIATKLAGFGARITQLGARSVTAAFGLDVVEDAARHAAHAAFAVQRTAGTLMAVRPLPVRIALHTEELLVGRLDDRIELAADGTWAAQRVLDDLLAATPGEPIVASPAAKSFLERRFDVEPAAGHEGPLMPWRVRGLVDSDRSTSPFVARGRELAVLDDLLTQAADGRGQAVLIAGDAGIGKTRLLREFRRRASDRAAWLQGAAVPFGSALPLHPIIDLLKHAFSIQAGDPDAVIRERIDGATAAFGEAFRPAARFLHALVSVDAAGDASLAPLDPKLRRAGIFEAIGLYLHALAEARPLILLLEDLHWADQATGEFLTMMTERLVSGRIVLCVTQRTGYTLSFSPAAFATQLTLSRLSAADSAAIACSMLGTASLSPALQALIDEKTEGNPFFVEEVLRSLQEQGLLEPRGDRAALRQATATLEVPDRVEDVLLGRLERLDAASRDLLRVAATIGRAFPRRVLERVAADPASGLDDRLRVLRAAELIHQARVWPDAEYVFKHALTHEAAYRAQAEAERQRQHDRIGVAIEQEYADRLPEQFGVLAHHFRQAQRWDKALEYLLAAARQAERTFATREALTLYDEALRAAERLAGGVGDPATVIGIHAAKARLYFVTSDFERSSAEGERILPLARLIGDRASEAEALAAIAWASLWGRDVDAAIRFSQEALAVAEPARAMAVQGRAHFTIGFGRAVTGGLDESHAAIERAMTISGAAGDGVHLSLALSTAGLLRNWTGDFAEAARLQDEGLALARERGLLVPLLFSCFLRGLTLTGKGDYDDAFAVFTEGLELAERVGDEAIHHRLLNCLGWLYADLGDLDRAEELNTMSAHVGRRRNDPGTQPNAELNLAEIFHARGDRLRAQDQYDAVFRYWKNPPSQWMRFRYSMRMFAGLGELALARGDRTGARAHNADCLDVATRTGSRKNQVKAWRLAASIAHAERDSDAAEQHFRRSLTIAASLGNPVQYWKAEIVLGRFLEDVGRRDDARAAFQRAAAVMERVRHSLREQRLRDALAKNPDLQAIRTRIAGV